jgi:hypothetical protein
MNLLGWIGNVLIVIGLWKIGDKWRHAFLFSIVGEIIWIIKSLYFKQYDLAFICVIFAALSARSWYKWNK